MDWQVGDLAVRVAPCLPNRQGVAHPLRKGGIYRVEAVLPADFDGSIGLRIVGKRGRGLKDGFKAETFRKLTAASDSFTASIKACRPAHRKTPVDA